MHRSMRATLLAMSVGLAAPAVGAIESTAVDEYTRRLKVHQTIQPIGEAPFGESINLYTGEISFANEDIVLEGLGPTITITRQYQRQDTHEQVPFGLQRGFSDWVLAIPHMATLTPGNSKLGGVVGTWRVEGPDGLPTDQRCSQFSSIWSPPGGLAPKYGEVELDTWWHGYQLVVPGAGRQDVLLRNPSNTRKPATGLYPGVTAGNWQIGCLPSTRNGHAGEGFLVLSPDGLRYHLDHLAYSAYSTMNAIVDGSGDKPIMYYLTRKLARMYASRVEDRFGNAITYHYSGDRLTDITATDGRRVAIDWDATEPLVTAIRTMPGTGSERTWRYEYAGQRLAKAIRPDGSAWTYAMGGIAPEILPLRLDGCFTAGGPPHVSGASSPPGHVDASATVTHPSGLVGQFRVAWRLRAQTSALSWCTGLGEVFENGNPYFLSMALVDKTFSGPGVSPMTWRYSYEPRRERRSLLPDGGLVQEHHVRRHHRSGRGAHALHLQHALRRDRRRTAARRPRPGEWGGAAHRTSRIPLARWPAPVSVAERQRHDLRQQLQVGERGARAFDGRAPTGGDVHARSAGVRCVPVSDAGQRARGRTRDASPASASATASAATAGGARSARVDRHAGVHGRFADHDVLQPVVCHAGRGPIRPAGQEHRLVR